MNAEDSEDRPIAVLVDKIQDVLVGHKIEYVMTALCSIIGHARFDMYGDDMTKREFIAKLVEDIGACYEHAKEESKNG